MVQSGQLSHGAGSFSFTPDHSGHYVLLLMSDEADGASEAIYRVTAENETRVSGDEITPC
jgi:hypothetical protein